MNGRMDSQKLNIGAYYLAPCARSEEHVRELRECGVDFVVGMDNDRPALDMLLRHGVGAVVRGVVPSWWGGNTEKAGRLAQLNPLERYREGAEAFCDHPAVWGIDMGDEPSLPDLVHMGKALKIVENCCPDQFGYLNLFPSYGSHADKSAEEVRRQLGTDSYSEYLHGYCRLVDTDYICLDFYVFTSRPQRFYRDLHTAANTGRDLWCVLQVNTRDENHPLSEEMLAYQAYTALAFGAKNIIWACYSPGWWHCNVLDMQGQKTVMYDRLKKVNRELHALSEEYMKYRWRDTHFVGFDAARGLPKPPVDKLSAAGITDLHSDGRLIVGEMQAKSGSGGALMIMPEGGGADEVTVEFECALPQVSICGGGGKFPLFCNDGRYTVKIRQSQGALVSANAACAK